MKLLNDIVALAPLFPSVALARWFPRGEAPSGCGFTLTSSGSIACPAGQLEDGQIRLNGNYSTTTFYIDSEGGIRDIDGFGCIVTGKQMPRRVSSC